MGITAKKEEKKHLLSHEETLELIQKAQKGDEDAKELLISSNLGLVRSVVGKFANIGYEREDLFQLGSIGLIKAIHKFDLSYNVKFSTYAVPMILGEIKRYLRDDGMVKVSRSLKQLAIKIKVQSEALSKKLGRDPTIEEIAEELNVEKEDVVMAIESNFSVEYLQGVIHEEEGSPICLIDKIAMKGADQQEKVVDNILLKEVLGKLEKRERQIIMLRYFEDKTQSEIGKMLNISQVQVSRIEKKVLHKLKSYITM
ncbi:RNA polymerase sporulation sigma factor SigF [Intestinibacter sp.]|uniref:RNA polymerase sporulation sigma factor SigF n=1 Tax=Intestinibacter sp. TaxID=1965304 RepID=UPI002A74FBA3|nr:RNA polymerase sporulation sigma factor SigF [Intestinibacter sp.]MDY2734651.1 RNA polymerase sporulation sigma factor SigF [Intestinibacter sp.]